MNYCHKLNIILITETEAIKTKSKLNIKLYKTILMSE